MKTGTTEKEVEVEKEVHIVNLFVIHLVFMGIYKILDPCQTQQGFQLQSFRSLRTNPHLSTARILQYAPSRQSQCFIISFLKVPQAGGPILQLPGSQAIKILQQGHLGVQHNLGTDLTAHTVQGGPSGRGHPFVDFNLEVAF